MITCDRTECPWWDEDGCLFFEEWEEGEYMNRPEEEEDDYMRISRYGENNNGEAE